MAEFARDTCVQMVEVSQGDSAFSNKLEIQQERGCSSYVGRHYAYQMLSLAPGCENSYIPLHEVRSLEFDYKVKYTVLENIRSWQNIRFRAEHIRSSLMTHQFKIYDLKLKLDGPRFFKKNDSKLMVI